MVEGEGGLGPLLALLIPAPAHLVAVDVLVLLPVVEAGLLPLLIVVALGPVGGQQACWGRDMVTRVGVFIPLQQYICIYEEKL